MLSSSGEVMRYAIRLVGHEDAWVGSYGAACADATKRTRYLFRSKKRAIDERKRIQLANSPFRYRVVTVDP